MERIIMLAAIPLFTWTGFACFLGIYRFRYPPLAILGVGYLSWVVSCVLLTAILSPLSDGTVYPAMGLLAVGALCIFGYRLTFYNKMKAAGITPKRIFGFGAAK